MRFAFTYLIIFICISSSSDARPISIHGKLVSKSPSKYGDQFKSDDDISSGIALSAQDSKKYPMNGPLCMIGGTFLHMVLGTMYCWANFLSYVPPNLQFFDGVQKVGKQPDALYVLPMIIVAQCLAMPFGPILVKQMGASFAVLLGGLLVATGVFLSSFAKSLPLFMIAYSLLFGTGAGLGYTAPMIAGWKWLPNSKGLVSGVVLMGYGLGGFVFNLIGTNLANPAMVNPINGRFPDEVYKNFPVMLRKLSLMYAALVLLASSLISEPKPVPAPLPQQTTVISGKQQKAIAAPNPTPVSADLTVAQAIRTPQFWLLWSTIVCSASASLVVASVYKRFATSASALQGDAFQATVGGLGAVFNGGGRLLWGLLSDKIGFKKSFLLLTVLQATLHLLYPYSSSSKPLFLVMTCMCFLALAGNFALVPPGIQRMYGATNGARIYGILFSAFGVASVGGLFLTKILLAKFDFETVFRVLSGASFLAAIIISTLTPVKSFAASTV